MAGLRPFLYASVVILHGLGAATGCHRSHESSTATDSQAPAGKMVDKPFSVGAFHGLEVHQAIEVVIAHGSEQSVKVQADESVLSKVIVNVKGDVLELGFDGNRRNKSVKVTVVTPELKSLTVHGASAVVWREVRQAALDLEIHGASSVEIAGQVDNLDLDVHGASSVDGVKLATKQATVRAHGASSVEVSVDDSLSVEAGGASSVSYHGNAQLVKKDVSGASSVSHS